MTNLFQTSLFDYSKTNVNDPISGRSAAALGPRAGLEIEIFREEGTLCYNEAG